MAPGINSEYMGFLIGVLSMLTSQRPAHRALACCDILEELVQYLQAEAKSEPHLALSRLARVSRAFNAFFTRKLWATLPSIVPLLRVLSTVQVVDFRPFARREEYVLAGPIASHEWSRCLYLASFAPRREVASPIHARALWEVVSSTSIELALLVSPSLRKLNLTFKGSDHDQDHWTVGLLALLRNAVPRMAGLSELHLYGLRLRRIYIANESIPADTIIKVLATSCSKAPVIDFAFNNDAGLDWSAQELLAVCRALAKRCPMLEKLAASVCVPGLDTLDTTIAPLTRLRSLREVKLNLNGNLGAPMNFIDTLFIMLAASWPRIVSLRLSSDFPEGWVSPPALLAFANACPDLRELCIPILDLSLDANFGDVTDFPIRDHGLTVLRVQFPSEENEKLFALILDRLFPHIDVEASCGEAGWNQVLNEGLEFCQLARRNRMRQPQTDADES
ncbi:hypothetical protein C8T65DRAFT_744093 [Cerioporus squamosus]|nr:hypothetical protein C8T65DRAFT_744093 [Cerioporus squamosus]